VPPRKQRPLRLAVQDAALSRLKQGFESPRGRQFSTAKPANPLISWPSHLQVIQGRDTKCSGELAKTVTHVGWGRAKPAAEGMIEVGQITEAASERDLSDGQAGKTRIGEHTMRQQ
jgi:hypothetical protein